MTYEISFLEKLHHTFFVEAESESEALEKFDEMGRAGELDFSDGEVVDTIVSICGKKGGSSFDNENDSIEIKMDTGHLVARRNPDPNYDGVSITFETDCGDVVDIVSVECKAENSYKIIDVYCYEDICSEEFTRKYSLDSDEILFVLQ